MGTYRPLWSSQADMYLSFCVSLRITVSLEYSRHFRRSTSIDIMAPKIRRVAVIGAGPSGAIATDALVKEQAFDTIRVFDRRAGVGGTW